MFLQTEHVSFTQALIQGLLILGFLVACIYIYFLPPIIASRRRHSSTLLILFLNFFFGWSIVAWIALVIWAVSEDNTWREFQKREVKRRRKATRKGQKPKGILVKILLFLSMTAFFFTLLLLASKNEITKPYLKMIVFWIE